ncbi:aminotransferase class V-fold PLP-dependent enzyme [Nocardia macrotermitis]|uniref:Hercynylcysteine sulfoxide lyase n=1 Tax=Nocardia macrotermitis TaxID=2585198 RepID=A0A7K0CY15_9NOCA|nr:aminotransferase class V-fold PLP-dependent enzyme [Nocardia macrotermitis]MQY18331.1 hercynylcysteine sulfoxide lyase [Nocardia macrotermitis]
MKSLLPGEFAPETVYLDTAAFGLPPKRGLTALHAALHDWGAGRRTPGGDDEVDRLRAGFTRLLPGATPDDIAIANTVGTLVGPIAAGLPAGAEVLVAEGDFASVTNPFRYHGNLRVRTAPLERLAQEVRPSTALVAVSLAQSADGRLVDLANLRTATTAHNAHLLLDVSQAAGWLPLHFADADYWVCATFKWLLGARSVSLLAINPAAAELTHPTSPGWYAAADRWSEMYAPRQLATTARRHDSTPDGLGVLAARIGLDLIDELTVEAVGAHDLALAQRFRTGLAALDIPAVPGDSPIVTIPGEYGRADRVEAADIVATTRNNFLRFAFHVHNTSDDVDRALTALGEK